MAHDPPETILALAIGRNTARQRGQSARSDQCVDHVDTARSERHASRSKGRHHRARSADRRHHEHYYKLTAAATAAVAPGRYTDALRLTLAGKTCRRVPLPSFFAWPSQRPDQRAISPKGDPTPGPRQFGAILLKPGNLQSDRSAWWRTQSPGASDSWLRCKSPPHEKRFA